MLSKVVQTVAPAWGRGAERAARHHRLHARRCAPVSERCYLLNSFDASLTALARRAAAADNA